MTALFFGLLIAALVVLYSSLVWGLVIYKFWYWFLLPVFPDLQHITFGMAVGLIYVLNLFKYHETTKNKNDETDYSFLANPWLVLILGYFTYLVIN